MGFRLIAQNSFDRTLRVSFALGLIRLVCTNGMTTMEKEISMIKKHSQSFNLDDFIAGDALETAIKRLDSSVNVYKLLARQDVSQEQGLTILNNLTTPRFKKVLSEKAREGVARIWNNPTHDEDADRNLYNLNNAVTQHLTHEVADERFEYANRVTTNVLKRFDMAARNKGRLEKLWTPAKSDAVVVVAE